MYNNETKEVYYINEKGLIVSKIVQEDLPVLVVVEMKETYLHKLETVKHELTISEYNTFNNGIRRRYFVAGSRIGEKELIIKILEEKGMIK
jgi:hypothetical protein